MKGRREGGSGSDYTTPTYARNETSVGNSFHVIKFGEVTAIGNTSKRESIRCEMNSHSEIIMAYNVMVIDRNYY